MAGPKQRVVKGENGEFDVVPITPHDDLNVLAGCVDLEAAGLGVSKTVYTDTFKHNAFLFRLRYVGRDVLLANDVYLKHVIQELGLETMVEEFQDFSLAPDPEEARFQAAIALYASGGYRVKYPELSTRADELVGERYELVLLGTDPEGDDPKKWGGLVGWNIDRVPASKFPFSPENVRKLNLQTKALLYGRLLSLTREGATDAQFRQASGL